MNQNAPPRVNHRAGQPIEIETWGLTGVKLEAVKGLPLVFDRRVTRGFFYGGKGSSHEQHGAGS